jgi:hypothetical protein
MNKHRSGIGRSNRITILGSATGNQGKACAVPRNIALAPPDFDTVKAWIQEGEIMQQGHDGRLDVVAL